MAIHAQSLAQAAKYADFLMKPYTKGLETFNGWRELNAALLREMVRLPNQTVFILNTLVGHAHICQLSGNLPNDESVKAQRMTDFKYIRLENVRRGALVSILPNAVHEPQATL